MVNAMLRQNHFVCEVFKTQLVLQINRPTVHKVKNVMSTLLRFQSISQACVCTMHLTGRQLSDTLITHLMFKSGTPLSPL